MDEFVFEKPLFGKNVRIIVYDIEPDLANDIANKAYIEGLRLSKIFNIYDKSSEISLLNKNRKMKVSSEFIELLIIAKEFYVPTNGKYDVSLGKIIHQRKNGLKETAKCSFEDILIESNFINLNNDDVIIDLGSIAKGFIVDKMIEILIKEGVISGLVDGRGDIRIFGEKKEIIGIQHPRDKDKIIANINVTNCAIATSGDYNQYYKTYDTSHIINSLDFSSVTVVAENLTLADGFATAFFVSKSDKLLEKYKDIKVMTISKDLNIKYYNGFEELI
ncbi:MAG: FAD:protein FMN transferase [Candidatus Woesearchaeota archaeon]